MNSLYSLTWGDYGTSLVSAVQLLRCHGDLVDCTLAAGGRSFPAHKIVLCAASPFLLDLLKVKKINKFFFHAFHVNCKFYLILIQTKYIKVNDELFHKEKELSTSTVIVLLLNHRNSANQQI